MNESAPSLGDLPTPCLVLDRSKMDRNLARMRQRAETLGVRLRPHCKTAKSAEVARLALGGEVGPITVSTMREAQYFAENGFTDITLAVGISPSRLGQAAELLARGIDLSIITDNAVIAGEIVAAGKARGVTFAVMIEVDVGEHRAGIDAHAPELLEIARILTEGGQELRGILAHGGHTYRCQGEEEVAEIAEQERAGAVLAAERLRQAGHACPVVSVGSTPGALFAKSLDGVTEMRPGVYMFMDLFQSGVGCCGLEDIAVTVMASITNLRPEQGTAIIDAGALALSKDRSTQAQPRDCDFGLLTDAFGRPLPGLTVEAVHQEHGRIGGTGADPAVLPIGSRVHVLPNHVCMTAAMYDRYAVVEGLDKGPNQPVVAFWERVNGW